MQQAPPPPTGEPGSPGPLGMIGACALLLALSAILGNDASEHLLPFLEDAEPMLVRRAILPGVLVGLATALACLAYVWTPTDIPPWWYGAFTIVPSFVAGAIASCFFPAPPPGCLKDTMLVT